MKRHVFLLVTLFTMSTVAAQQQPIISPKDSIPSVIERVTGKENKGFSAHMNLQLYTSCAASFTENELDEVAFKLNRFKLEIIGNINRKFSYHFRQSFNKYSNPFALDNLSSSVEYAYLTYHLSDRFSITAGKQFLMLGGYEYYVNPIKVREFSEFNNYVNCFLAGVSATWNVTPTQELNFQIVNNRNGGDADTYLHGLPTDVEATKVPLISTINWNSYYLDKAIQLRYAASWGQQAKGRNIMYLTAGNVYEKGPWIVYMDFMYSRQGIDNKGIISALPRIDLENPQTAQHTEYFTTIANVDYRFHPNWNAYLKGIYESGKIYKANGIFEKGTYRRTWCGQVCVEYYPMRNSELLIFLHYQYKRNKLLKPARNLDAIDPNTQRISLAGIFHTGFLIPGSSYRKGERVLYLGRTFSLFKALTTIPLPFFVHCK